MLEYLINGASIVCLAGCLWIAYQIVIHSQAFGMVARRGGAKAARKHAADEQEFRNPSLGYYI